MLQWQRYALTLLLFLAGCASWGYWQDVGGEYIDHNTCIQAELPQGWFRLNPLLTGNKLVITRDGLLLQSIVVQRVALAKDLDHTKKKFSIGMSPQEVAAIELEEVQSNPEVTRFALLEDTSAVIDGQQGFKLVYTYRTHDGLRLKNVHYGLLMDQWVYRIQYQAPMQYYFERDIITFEQVLEHLHFLSNGC